jgi:hypothetical protein
MVRSSYVTYSSIWFEDDQDTQSKVLRHEVCDENGKYSHDDEVMWEAISRLPESTRESITHDRLEVSTLVFQRALAQESLLSSSKTNSSSTATSSSSSTQQKNTAAAATAAATTTTETETTQLRRSQRTHSPAKPAATQSVSRSSK